MTTACTVPRNYSAPARSCTPGFPDLPTPRTTTALAPPPIIAEPALSHQDPSGGEVTRTVATVGQVLSKPGTVHGKACTHQASKETLGERTPEIPNGSVASSAPFAIRQESSLTLAGSFSVPGQSRLLPVMPAPSRVMTRRTGDITMQPLPKSSSPGHPVEPRKEKQRHETSLATYLAEDDSDSMDSERTVPAVSSTSAEGTSSGVF